MRTKDREALQLAMTMAREPPDGRGEQIDSMLKKREWFYVARFASAHCQCRALRLRPWELPPVWVGVGDDPQAEQLWKRMRACGVSRYHPDPIKACETAESRRQSRVRVMSALPPKADIETQQ
jgi:hypothetical protein